MIPYGNLDIPLNRLAPIAPPLRIPSAIPSFPLPLSIPLWRQLASIVGAPVTIHHVDSQFVWYENNLTDAIVSQLQEIRRAFIESFPQNRITKIEFIVNDNLYSQFDATKKALLNYGHSSSEVLLFHGTSPENVQSYSLVLSAPLTFSIIREGFRIGGLTSSPYPPIHVSLFQLLRI